MRTISRPPSRLRTIREARNLSRQKLSSAAGIATSTLYLAELGVLSAATAGKLAAALDLPVEALLPEPSEALHP